MHRELIHLAILVAILLLLQRLKRVFLLFSVAVLPGTLCHELCHLCVGAAMGGKPTNFTILPRREGRSWVMGSVAFARVRWYNAFFLGMAPLLLLPAAYGLLRWRLGNAAALGWEEALWLYLIANLIHASLPSWQDLRIAARSPVGWLLLAAAAAYGWHRYRSKPEPAAWLEQLQEPRSPRVHAALGNPGTHIGLGQAHEIR